MNIVQINTVFPGGSTGKICKGIAESCRENGMDCYVAYAHGKGQGGANEIAISSWLDHHVHNRLARMTMAIGQFSYFRTKRFLRKLKKLHPDVLHLHNLHANYINLRLLFRFIKKEKIAVIWTLHDCWSFTGYCAHYGIVQCDKWKTECDQCPNRHSDPATVLDRSRTMFRKKKKLFCGVDQLTVVTPSEWLAGQVRQSYLQDYPIRVINNGIDLRIFKPTCGEFRMKHGIRDDEFVLLGVANVWDRRKGLDVFVELSKRLGSQYRIVLVGTNDRIDSMLPKNVISIHRTQNQTELAEIYSAADLFVNPTLEDTYPTVNMESVACGTPVLTYDTGGSAEMIDETCGSVVAQGDVDALEREIVRICRDKPYSIDACLRRAAGYDMYVRFQEYVDLYREARHD